MVFLWSIFRNHFWAYEVTLISSHALLSFLLYLLLRRESRSSEIAFILSLYYCVSPVCSEEILWLTMLSQTLMAICYVLAMLNWNRGLWPAVLLFLSFGLFGGGPILLLPFVVFLLTRPKPIRWRTVFSAGVAFATFIVFKMGFGPDIPFSASSATLSSALLGLVTGIQNFLMLSSIDWSARLFLIALAGLTAAGIVRSRLSRLSAALPGLALFGSYCIVAFVYRQNVERRHLYFGLIGLLWMAAIFAGNRWSPKLYWALASLFAVTCCFDWAFVQKEIDSRYEAVGRKAARFTKDYRRALQSGTTLYDTAVIAEVNQHVLLSQYAPIAGANGRFISDSISARSPITWVHDPTSCADHYRRLWQWLKQQPLESPVREFYTRYYPVGLIYETSTE